MGRKTIDFDRLASALAPACPQLVHLQVGEPVDDEVMLYQLGLAKWSSIKILLASCLHLIALLIHCCEFPFDVQQLTDVLANRRTWQKLAIYTDEMMQLDILQLYAQYCPNLTDLCVFVDGSREVPFLDPDNKPTHSFPALERIDFVHSGYGNMLRNNLCTVFVPNLRKATLSYRMGYVVLDLGVSPHCHLVRRTK